MNYKVVILSEAELDIEEAFIWYELNQIGLGKKGCSLILRCN